MKTIQLLGITVLLAGIGIAQSARLVAAQADPCLQHSDAAIGDMIAQYGSKTKEELNAIEKKCQEIREGVADANQRRQAQFPPRTTSVEMHSLGKDVLMRVNSTVEGVTNIPQSFRDFVKEEFERDGEEPPATYEVYLYHYEILNWSSSDKLLHLEGGKFFSSTFVDMVGGFQLLVPAGKMYRISFLATVPPSAKAMSAHVTVANRAPFKILAGFSPALYCPDSEVLAQVTEKSLSAIPK